MVSTTTTTTITRRAVFSADTHMKHYNITLLFLFAFIAGPAASAQDSEVSDFSQGSIEVLDGEVEIEAVEYWDDGALALPFLTILQTSAHPPASPSTPPPPPNRPPTVTLRTVDSTIPQNGSTTLIATGNDHDGTIVTYTFFRDGIEVQSGQLDYYIYNDPTVGRRQFAVIVIDDRGAQASSEAIAIEVEGSSGPVVPVGQWADVNGDGILDQVLATIERPERAGLVTTIDGISLIVDTRERLDWATFVDLGPFSGNIFEVDSFFSDPIPSFAYSYDPFADFRPELFKFGHILQVASGILYAVPVRTDYIPCLKIPSSLAWGGFEYQVQSSDDGESWENRGPSMPGSIYGISFCFGETAR